MTDHIFVSEIFRSVQGEGPFAGRSATFLRTAYCNLKCTWCDAWYTWDHTRIDVKAKSKKYSIKELADELRKPILANNLLVITGGEPLLWREQLAKLMTDLHFPIVQFETNGTIKPIVPWAHYVVSPKLENSGEYSVNEDVLSYMARLPNTHLKFVIDDVTKEFGTAFHLSKAMGFPSHRVWMMPLGVTEEAIQSRTRQLMLLCAVAGVNYSDRLHIRAYGDMRGT